MEGEHGGYQRLLKLRKWEHAVYFTDTVAH